MSSRSTYFVILLPRSMSLIATCSTNTEEIKEGELRLTSTGGAPAEAAQLPSLLVHRELQQPVTACRQLSCHAGRQQIQAVWCRPKMGKRVLTCSLVVRSTARATAP
jgi:hypothetical protein